MTADPIHLSTADELDSPWYCAREGCPIQQLTLRTNPEIAPVMQCPECRGLLWSRAYLEEQMTLPSKLHPFQVIYCLRGDRRNLLIERDRWIEFLSAAFHCGWNPHGAAPNTENYLVLEEQHVSRADAANLGKALESWLMGKSGDRSNEPDLLPPFRNSLFFDGFPEPFQRANESDAAKLRECIFFCRQGGFTVGAAPARIEQAAA